MLAAMGREQRREGERQAHGTLSNHECTSTDLDRPYSMLTGSPCSHLLSFKLIKGKMNTLAGFQAVLPQTTLPVA